MVTTGDDALFVDTNVLIYATNPRSPWRAGAIRALQTAHQQGLRMVVSPQVLREYIAAASRPATDGRMLRCTSTVSATS